jgi:hypothetical protein
MADHDHLVCRLDAFEQGQVVSIDRRRPDRSAGQQAHPSRRDATRVQRSADTAEHERPRRVEPRHLGPREQRLDRGRLGGHMPVVVLAAIHRGQPTA